MELKLKISETLKTLKPIKEEEHLILKHLLPLKTQTEEDLMLHYGRTKEELDVEIRELTKVVEAYDLAIALLEREFYSL